MLASDSALIIYSWFLITAFGALSAPLVLVAAKDLLADAGWALTKVVTWVLVGCFIWFTAHLGLPTNTTLGFWLGLAILTASSAYVLYHYRAQITRIIKSKQRLFILEEIIFSAGFVFLSIIRGFNPHILDLEKFMDAGFMASYLKSPTLPAPDIWLAGETINYYSFGHFLGSLITRLWNLNIAYSYNLLLGLVMGLGLLLSFSIGYNLAKKLAAQNTTAVITGLVTSLLVIVAGNSHTAIMGILNKGFDGYWYADATRFIYHTIHEFPSYSFVVSDLHAHVWSLPLVLAFLLVLIIWQQAIFAKNQRYLIWSVPLGVLVGIFVMTSAWDALIYPLTLAITGIIITIYQPDKLLRLIKSACIAAFTASLIAAPWLINFESISNGIAIVETRSPLKDFATLWAGHLILGTSALILAVYLLYTSKFKPAFLLIIGLFASALVLLLIPELVYVVDIYTDHPRANTMFKLTYQAFILLSITAASLIPLSTSLRVSVKGAIRSLLVIIALGLSLFPFFAYRDYYGRLSDYKGLHGYRWLEKEAPNDYQAAQWLQQNVSDQPTILEAVGESYTKHNRFSVITGLPTVLGWRVHEWLWRGGFDIPSKRTEEVKTIYQNPTSQEARQLLNQYQVRYIIIGEKEYESYSEIDTNGLLNLGEVVFNQGNTYIIAR